MRKAISTSCVVLGLGVLSVDTIVAQPPLNVRINSVSSLTQNEEQIWINLTDPTSVVANWRDFRLGYRRIGVGVSTDGGATWSDSLVIGQHEWQSDPAMVGDRIGTLYMTTLDFNPNTMDEDSSQISVWCSTNGGQSWTGPVAVAPIGPHFEEKVFTAVDRTGGPYDGNLYLSWVRFSAGEGIRIMFARSSDRAQSFDTTVVGPTVTTSNCGESSPGVFSIPIVNSDGSVHVFWTGEDIDSTTCYSENAIRHAYSIDGGMTFTSDSLAFLRDAVLSSVGAGVSVYGMPNGDADVSGGPYDGTIYISQCQNADMGLGTDVKVRKSTDDGISWTDPIVVNDDIPPLPSLHSDQFHPWLIVNEDGVVVMVFYDQRNDPYNNRKFDCYFAASFDGAETFIHNYRLSDVSSDPDDLAAALRARSTSQQRDLASESPDSLLHPKPCAGLIAEYIGVHAKNDYVVAAWTDTREGNQDVYSARFAIPFMNPRLYLPEDGSQTPDTAVSFRWSTCWHETQDSYLLEVSSDSGFGLVEASYEGLADNNFTQPSPLPTGHYYWRVKAFRVSGDSTDYSEVFEYESGCQPAAAPSLLSPALGDTIPGPTVAMNWDIVGNAFEYGFQLSSDSGFSTTIVDTLVLQPGYTATGLTDYLATYYWRANATDSCAPGDWSESQFVVCQPAVSPLLLWPVPGDTLADSTVTLDWEVVEDAYEYRLQFSAFPDFSSALVDTALPSPGYVVTGLSRITYYWRVNASNTCGTGEWSESEFTRCPIDLTGDVNTDSLLTSADIIYLVNYVFKGGVEPLPIAAAGDVNCDGVVTSSDIIYMVNHVFKSASAPCDVCSIL